jgi:hypothetical protein
MSFNANAPAFVPKKKPNQSTQLTNTDVSATAKVDFQQRHEQDVDLEPFFASDVKAANDWTNVINAQKKRESKAIEIKKPDGQKGIQRSSTNSVAREKKEIGEVADVVIAAVKANENKAKNDDEEKLPREREEKTKQRTKEKEEKIEDDGRGEEKVTTTTTTTTMDAPSFGSKVVAKPKPVIGSAFEKAEKEVRANRAAAEQKKVKNDNDANTSVDSSKKKSNSKMSVKLIAPEDSPTPKKQPLKSEEKGKKDEENVEKDADINANAPSKGRGLFGSLGSVAGSVVGSAAQFLFTSPNKQKSSDSLVVTVAPAAEESKVSTKSVDEKSQEEGKKSATKTTTPVKKNNKKDADDDNKITPVVNTVAATPSPKQKKEEKSDVFSRLTPGDGKSNKKVATPEPAPAAAAPTSSAKKKNNNNNNNNNNTPEKDSSKVDIRSRLTRKDGTPVVASPPPPQQQQQQQQQKNDTPNSTPESQKTIARTVSRTVQAPKAQSPMKSEASPARQPPSGLMPSINLPPPPPPPTTPTLTEETSKEINRLKDEIKQLKTENDRLKPGAAQSGRLAAALSKAEESAAQRLRKDKEAVKLEREQVAKDRLELTIAKQTLEATLKELDAKKDVGLKLAEERVAVAEKKAEEAVAAVAKAKEEAKTAVAAAVAKAKDEAKSAAAAAAAANVISPAIPDLSSNNDDVENELKSMREELEKNRLALKQAKTEARILQKQVERLNQKLEDAKKDPQAFEQRVSDGTFMTPTGTPSKSSSFDSSYNDDSELSASKSKREFMSNLLLHKMSQSPTPPQKEVESITLVETRAELEEMRKAKEELSRILNITMEEKDGLIAKLRKENSELKDKKSKETLLQAADQEESKKNIEKYEQDILNLNNEVRNLRNSKPLLQKANEETLDLALKLKKADEEISSLKNKLDESETFKTEREQMIAVMEKKLEQIDVLQGMNVESKKVLAAKLEVIAGLEENLTTTQEFMKKCKTDLKEALQKALDKQIELTAKETELQQLKSGMASKAVENIEILAFKKEVEQKLNLLESEKSALIKTKESLENEKKNLSQSLEEANARIEKEKNVVSETFSSSVTSKDTEIETLKMQILSMKKSNDELVTSLTKSIETEKSSLSAENQSLRKRFDELSKNAGKAESLEASQCIAVAASQNAMEMLAVSESEKDQLRENIKKLEGVNSETIKYAQEETKKFEVEKKSLIEKVDVLTKHINSTTTDYESRMKSLEATKTIAEEGAKNAKELQEENAKLHSKIITFEAKTKKLENDIQIVEKEKKLILLEKQKSEDSIVVVAKVPPPPPLASNPIDSEAYNSMKQRAEKAERDVKMSKATVATLELKVQELEESALTASPKPNGTKNVLEANQAVNGLSSAKVQELSEELEKERAARVMYQRDCRLMQTKIEELKKSSAGMNGNNMNGSSYRISDQQYHPQQQQQQQQQQRQLLHGPISSGKPPQTEPSLSATQTTTQTRELRIPTTLGTNKPSPYQHPGPSPATAQRRTMNSALLSTSKKQTSTNASLASQSQQRQQQLRQNPFNRVVISTPAVSKSLESAFYDFQ